MLVPLISASQSVALRALALETESGVPAILTHRDKIFEKKSCPYSIAEQIDFGFGATYIYRTRTSVIVLLDAD